VGAVEIIDNEVDRWWEWWAEESGQGARLRARLEHLVGLIQRLTAARPTDAESLQQEVEDLLRRTRKLLADMDQRQAERRREMEISLRRIEDARRTLRRAGILKSR
jgi:hypothetical protein